MADQITVIDLSEAEFDCEEPESYQDKVAKLDTKVSQMEQEINNMKEMIVDLKNSFTEGSKAYSAFGIATLPPFEGSEAYSLFGPAAPTFDYNDQLFSSMHSSLIKESFNNLSETSKSIAKGGRHFDTETNQISFTNESALPFEMNYGNTPIYDRVGSPVYHLKAYVHRVRNIGQKNELKMRLFVRTLTGPALMWYAMQGMWKWSSWGNLVNDFVRQHGSSSSISRGVVSSKKKSTEFPRGPKGKEPSSSFPAIFASTYNRTW